jgi:hypothetical protein
VNRDEGDSPNIGTPLMRMAGISRLKYAANQKDVAIFNIADYAYFP